MKRTEFMVVGLIHYIEKEVCILSAPKQPK
jgi:hypothetical protein